MAQDRPHLRRTETVDKNESITIHAEKNQDIEVENDETHLLGDLRAAAFPTTVEGEAIHYLSGADGDSPLELRHQRISGDWNGDGRDTVGLMGDFDGDGSVDAADY